MLLLKIYSNIRIIFSYKGKKYFLYILLLLSSCDKIYIENELHGVWKGKLHNKEIILSFNNDNNFELSLTDHTTKLNEILNGIYQLDFTKKPIPLSLLNIKQLSHPLHTIVEFMGADSFRLVDFSPSWRVRNISFEQNRNFVLKRVN